MSRRLPTRASDLLADTSGWASIVDPTQSQHTLAAAIYREARRERRLVITTNYVITELVALMASPLRIPRRSVIAFIQGMKASPHVQVVNITPDLDDAAWQLLTRRLDKAWSLVDCASFVVMQQRGILDALATDHHFEQAGFIRLLK